MRGYARSSKADLWVLLSVAVRVWPEMARFGVSNVTLPVLLMSFNTISVPLRAPSASSSVSVRIPAVVAYDADCNAGGAVSFTVMF